MLTVTETFYVSPGPISKPVAMEVKQFELAARSRDIEAIVNKLEQDTHRSLTHWYSIY